jgi:hypothetical protein
MDSDSSQLHSKHLRISPLWWLGCFFILPCIFACTSGEVRPTQKVKTADSLPFMHSVGVSTLISDSGIIRYHLVAEEWDIYTPASQAATWKFIKGLLMLRLDEDQTSTFMFRQTQHIFTNNAHGNYMAECAYVMFKEQSLIRKSFSGT